MKNIIYYLPAVLGIFLLPLMAWAQPTTYTLDESSTMVIKGTSTIHDWEVDVEKMEADITLAASDSEDNEAKNLVEAFSITIPVESLESGKRKMNRKMYDALKKDDHPEIMFFLKSAELTDNNQSAQSFTLNATGNLNIAGSLQEVTFPVKATRVDESSFRFEGSYSLNMKDYQVDPPSAVFGTIKSGEEVTIVFNILVNK